MIMMVILMVMKIMVMVKTTTTTGIASVNRLYLRSEKDPNYISM